MDLSETLKDRRKQGEFVSPTKNLNSTARRRRGYKCSSVGSKKSAPLSRRASGYFSGTSSPASSACNLSASSSPDSASTHAASHKSTRKRRCISISASKSELTQPPTSSATVSGMGTTREGLNETAASFSEAADPFRSLAECEATAASGSTKNKPTPIPLSDRVDFFNAEMGDGEPYPLSHGPRRCYEGGGDLLNPAEALMVPPGGMSVITFNDDEETFDDEDKEGRLNEFPAFRVPTSDIDDVADGDALGLEKKRINAEGSPLAAYSARGSTHHHPPSPCASPMAPCRSRQRYLQRYTAAILSDDYERQQSMLALGEVQGFELDDEVFVEWLTWHGPSEVEGEHTWVAPFLLAARWAAPEVVHDLLVHGVDPKCVSSHGENALVALCAQPRPSQDMIDCLYREGHYISPFLASANRRVSGTANPFTATLELDEPDASTLAEQQQRMFEHRSSEMVLVAELLLAAGVSPLVPDDRGQTALQYTIEFGHDKIHTLLVNWICNAAAAEAVMRAYRQGYTRPERVAAGPDDVRKEDERLIEHDIHTPPPRLRPSLQDLLTPPSRGRSPQPEKIDLLAMPPQGDLESPTRERSVTTAVATPEAKPAVAKASAAKQYDDDPCCLTTNYDSALPTACCGDDVLSTSGKQPISHHGGKQRKKGRRLLPLVSEVLSSQQPLF